MEIISMAVDSRKQTSATVYNRLVTDGKKGCCHMSEALYISGIK